jgi:hypothetical protein
MSSEYVSQGEIPLNTYQITALADQIKNTSSCTALQQIIEQAINSVTSLISGIIQTQLDILADFFPILNIPGPNPFAIVKWIRKLVFGTAVTQYLAYIQYAIQLIDLSAALSSLITAIQEAISLSGCIITASVQTLIDDLDIINAGVAVALTRVSEKSVSLQNVVGAALTLTTFNTSNATAFKSSVTTNLPQFKTDSATFMATAVTPDTIPIVGQVLTANTTGDPYWSPAVGPVSGQQVLASNSANLYWSPATAGGQQLLTSNSTSLYWSPATSPTAGQILASNGSDLYWSDNAMTRNRIINGNMYIAQRATSATVTAGTTVPTASTGYPCVDRWFVYSTGANVTAAQVAGSGSNKNLLQITGAASVTAVGIGQRIEQLNSYDLAGQTCTLAVDISNSLLTTVTWTASYATTTADTFGTIGTPTKTQIATGTFTVTSTLTRYTVNISVPAAATKGIEILFTVGAQTSGTWQIGNVQFEPGTVATPYERRQHTQELQLCQRHYWATTTMNFASYMVNTDTMYHNQPIRPFMFATPTMTQASFTVSSGGSFTFTNITNGNYVLSLQNNSGGAGRVFAVSGTITASAEIP